MLTKGMRTIHLFAGAGGGILADILLGHRPICAIEINEFCQKVLVQRQQDGILPFFPIYGDIKQFDGTRWKGQVDIISAGFPCQPFSTAGRRKGNKDNKNLWPDTIRCIREMGPQIAFLENVPGLLRFDYFGEIIGDLADSGYDAVWDVISASEAGAPHQRERLWILAYTSQIRCNARGSQQPLQGIGTYGKTQANNSDGSRNTYCQESRTVQGIQRQSSNIRRDIRNINTKTQADGSNAYSQSCNEKGQGRQSKKQSRYRSGLARNTNERNAPWGWDDAQNTLGTDCLRILFPGITIRQTKSGIQFVVDGMANQLDRLAAVGNGQVPLVAATAFLFLAERAGLLSKATVDQVVKGNVAFPF